MTDPDDPTPKNTLTPEDQLAAAAVAVLMAIPASFRSASSLTELLDGAASRARRNLIPRPQLLALADALERMRPGLLDLALSRRHMQEQGRG
jgi:hypothetical protein